MKYKVGQVLYMTNPKSLKIIPVQVIEEVTRTTLKGIEKTYMIQFPDSKKTVADINTVTGELFANIDILKSTMIERATTSIEKMINIANQLAIEEYNMEQPVLLENQKEPGVQVETNNDIITVDLGNGVKAKMKTTELEKVANQ